MNTRLSAVAAALALASAPTFAASALELYGKVNLSLQKSEETSVLDAYMNGAVAVPSVESISKDNWELKSNASRLGVKGELSISDETVAFYQYEFSVGVDSGNPFGSRNAGVGVKGNFGTVFGGRWDTPFKLAQNKIDLFNDYDGDLTGVFTGETRAQNLVQYSTPKFGDLFTLNIAAIAHETPDVDTANQKIDGRDGLLDSASISAEFAISKDLYVALALDKDHQTGAYQDGAKDIRLVAQYTLNAFQFGFMYQKQDEADGIDGTDVGYVISASEALSFDTNKDLEVGSNKGTLLSVAYKISENGTLKFQTANSDIKYTDGKQTSIGYDQKLAKNIVWFAWYTKEEGSHYSSLGTPAVKVESSIEKTYLATGLEVKF